MGKEKEKGGEVPVGAFTRMNYLYQASQLIAQTQTENPLSNYYNKIMKDISKKLVEKLHPDLKRTICVACNYPLTPATYFINVKLKPNKKRKNKNKIKKSMCNDNKTKIFKTSDSTSSKYNKDRIEVRNKKPNRLKWQCRKCGFSKMYLSQPNYEIWIQKEQKFEKE